jgi:anti-anti-sigma factor
VIAVAIQADAYRDNLKVTVRQRASLTVLHLRGELDLATEPILHEAFVLSDLDGGIELAIDLRGLDFLRSTGIGMIVTACKRVRASGDNFSGGVKRLDSPHPRDHGAGRLPRTP